MAQFKPALQKILAHEGDYVNAPADPGGETYKGIARNIHSKWNGWLCIDVHKTQLPFPPTWEMLFQGRNLVESIGINLIR
ncbi:MAG: glycosyl hydrolase 108 family protein [Prolixibacteraceae bacterium]|nr:glycosyl hydrolase 108 family protein [Prolixibacteraceae bacterium]